MKQLHNAKITVFIKPEEYTPEIMEEYGQIMHTLAPLDFDKEKLHISQEIVDGLEGRKIRILILELLKESHTNTFIKTLREYLGDECQTLVDQKESRLDEDLYFYIRLDKRAALEHKFELTDSGDCIHIRLSLAAFPKNKQAALKVVDKIFG